MMGWAPWVRPWRGRRENCITLPMMVMAPTATSPPYFNSEVLKQMFRMLSVNCITKGDAPSAMAGIRISALGLI